MNLVGRSSGAILIVFLVASTHLAMARVGGFGGEGKLHPPGRRDVPTSAVLKSMTRRLDLTEDQQARIAKILSETREEISDSAETAKAAIKETKEEIAELLTEQQKKTLKELKKDVGAGVGGYARSHGPEIIDGAKRAGEEIRLRIALNQLELSEEQIAKLKDIQKSVQEKREALHAELKPKIEAIQKEAKEQISTALTEEQRAELEKKIEEMENMRPGAGRRDFRSDLDFQGESPFRGPRPPRPGMDRRAGGRPPVAPPEDILFELFR